MDRTVQLARIGLRYTAAGVRLVVASLVIGSGCYLLFLLGVSDFSIDRLLRMLWRLTEQYVAGEEAAQASFRKFVLFTWGVAVLFGFIVRGLQVRDRLARLRSDRFVFQGGLRPPASPREALRDA